jgi:hypothetical protein
MESWIYLFSQFTPEALVLELALIFILCGGYAVFWILRKRKFGVVDKVLPSGPVKAYLNELIGNADHLRTQLFGLLSENTEQSALSNNSDLGKILSNLELKLDAQGKAIGNLSANGVPMAPRASDAALAPTSDNASAADSAEYNSLKEKVNHLETRLAEYSIIEDDLANLKRIQQENAELRATLARNGGALPASGATAAPVQVTAPEVSAPKAPAASEPGLAEAPSVAEAPKAAPAAEVSPPKKESAPAADSAPHGADMGEDDLIKEFEKMLQG